jgi:hypothetical protein
MTAPTLTTERRYWLTAAAADWLTYRDGLFILGARTQPEDKAQEIRSLIFAGLLTKNGDLIEITGAGRAALS